MALVVLTRPPSKDHYNTTPKKQGQEAALAKDKSMRPGQEGAGDGEEVGRGVVGPALMEVTLKMLTLGPRGHPAFTPSPSHLRKV
ncbi:hypothetical protein E2C01_086185 [Portunus trituberculatus]|uniref:Uncharacterized protein n=1 Tax=Portunus trituberculatus TaxID=210409 RepID=A0A5B7JAU7_PORTR|nr:hypothetical protein [Portunus trituberculatus]